MAEELMRRLMVGVVLLGMAACGDPETTDTRGYTKAPLETPEVLVRGEEPSPVAGLGRPNLPRARLDLAEAREEPAEAEGPAQEVALAPGVTQEQFDQGEEVFSGMGGCQVCHGPNGQGTQLAPSLVDDEWLNVSGPDPDELAQVITNGVPDPVEHPAPMPPMGGASLSEEQVQALAAYVASIGQS